MWFCRQEAVQEAAAVHRGHSEELPGFLLEEEVPAPPLGYTHLPEASPRPAGPPGLQPAPSGEEEKGGGRGVPQEDRGGSGEVRSPVFTCSLVAAEFLMFSKAINRMNCLFIVQSTDVCVFVSVQRKTEV